jgi:hypothetical protein
VINLQGLSSVSLYKYRLLKIKCDKLSQAPKLYVL